MDVADPRFQAMFTSHLFNLDPSHPSFKNTKATQSILTEKQRRREEQRRAEGATSAHGVTPPPREEADAGKQEAAESKQENDCDARAVKKTMDPSLSLLVKSIKSKTERFQARKRQKLV